MANRRRFLRDLSTMPLIGAVFSTPGYAASESGRDYFKELGVKPIINACGNYTRFTASLMPREVMQAMKYASTRYVRLNDLQNAVGARIAEITGAEAAMVSAGAASSIALGAAACIAGNNPDFIHRLPETSGMKAEVIIQKAHRNSYDHAIRSSGGQLVIVETAEQLEAAIGPNTAMMAFFNLLEPAGQIKAPEFAAIAKRRGIPALVDAAADIPPVENLSRFTKLGFELVCISGGKAISGPQSAGMLLGRRDLIEAAKLNTSPYSDSIHRGMKVNKEEILGMLVALEVYLKRDHEADSIEWERRVAVISEAVRGVPGITAETWIPPIASHLPHVKIHWDQAVIPCTVEGAMSQLRDGDPSIEAHPDSKDELILAVWTLKPGEEKVVANRLRAILKRARS
jgi:uncharacterized pyridoxal phosphate-dependent enzyme